MDETSFMEGMPANPEQEDIYQTLRSIGSGSLKLYRKLTPPARSWFLRQAEQVMGGDTATIEALYSVDYKRIPADPMTFLTHTDYMGHMRCWPAWVPLFEQVCRPFSGVRELMLTGAQGLGKCCREDTLVPTADGLLTMREVYESRPRTALSETGVQEVLHFHDEGDTEIREVVTERGYEMGGRPNHRVRVLEDGEIRWKELKDIAPRDIALLARGDDVWGTDDRISEAEAELLGAWTGDGWFQETGGPAFSVGKNKQPYARQVLIPLAVKLGWDCWIRPVKDRADIFTISETLGVRRRWQDDLGFRSGATKKHIPESIRRSPANVVCAFLRGWFDTDGTVYNDGATIEVSTSSSELARQAQVLLLNLGIVTTRSVKETDCNPSWTVRVLGRRSVEVFLTRIGFNHPKKAARAVAGRGRATGWACSGMEPVYGAHALVQQAWDNLKGRIPTRKPHQSVYSPRWGRSNLTKEKLAQMVAVGGVDHLPAALRRIYEDDLVTEPVEVVLDGRARCFDLTVQGDPSYVGNGFISHNTTFASGFVTSYKIHRLACMKDPARFYGLAPRTQITFGLYAMTKKQIQRVGFYVLKDQMIEGSPFFREVFPKSPHGKETILWEHGETRILVETGCLAEGTLIAAPGGDVPIESLAQTSERVTSFDGEGTYDAPYEGVVYSGIKPVFDLVLDDGRSVRATAEHKFAVVRKTTAVVDGTVQAEKVPLSELKEGDYVAVLPPVRRDETGELLRGAVHTREFPTPRERGLRVHWARVVSVSPAGEAPTYDVYNVPGKHLVFANGIGCSNSERIHAIGRGLFAVVADELNYYDRGVQTAKRARELVSELSKRLGSRFIQYGGDIPGVACFVSQTRTESDFLEQRIKKMGKRPGVLVVRGPRWKFNPLGYEHPHDPDNGLVGGFRDSDATFRVFRGTETVDPVVLDVVLQRPDGGYAITPDLNTEQDAYPTEHVIDVPVTHFQEFVDDIHDALRLTADVPSSAATPFFSRKEVVGASFRDDLPFPFATQTLGCYEGSTLQIRQGFNHKAVTGIFMGKHAPLRHPQAPRYIHLDLAFSRDRDADRAGIAMVHPSAHYFDDRDPEDDEAQVGEQVVIKDIEVDFYLALEGGPFGQAIDFLKVRIFIEWLRRIGFWIRKVSADSFQSFDMLQRLREQGFVTEVLSVDKNSKAYKVVRQVFSEGRFAIPYPRGYLPSQWGDVEEALKRVILFQEILGLEHHVQTDKVDHREKNPDGSKGSKDIIDGITGASFACIMDKVNPGDVPTTTTPRAELTEKLTKYMPMVSKWLQQERA